VFVHESFNTSALFVRQHIGHVAWKKL